MASRIIPFFPVVGGPWSGRVALESLIEFAPEEEETSEEVVGSLVAEVLRDSVKCDGESDDVENMPEVSKRRRAFHIV